MEEVGEEREAVGVGTVGTVGLGTVSLRCCDTIPICLHHHLRGGTWQSSPHSGSTFSRPVMLACVSFWF